VIFKVSSFTRVVADPLLSLLLFFVRPSPFSVRPPLFCDVERLFRPLSDASVT